MIFGSNSLGTAPFGGFSGILRDVAVTPSVISVTISIIAPAVLAAINVTALPTSVVGSLGVIDPTISAVRNVTESPATLSLTFSILSPTIRNFPWYQISNLGWYDDNPTPYKTANVNSYFTQY